MQALHCKLDVVLVQILSYIVQKPITAFARICPQQDPPLPGCGFHTQTPLAPTIIFGPPPLYVML